MQVVYEHSRHGSISFMAVRMSCFRVNSTRWIGCKLQPFVMHVLDFHQRVPGGVIHPHLRFILLPDRLGGCQRVVAIAHGEQQHRFIRSNPILGGESLRVCQLLQGAMMPDFNRRVIHQVAVQMS